MSDPVPAITETDAAGEIAKIYSDIRQVLGVGVVNLIWRHLATIPGALPWAWGTLRPLYVDGTIAGEATSLRAALELPNLPRFPPQVFAATGLSDGDLAAIQDVLAAYDRTNAMALIALSAALRRLDGAPALDSGESVPAEPQSALPLPPLLDLGDMTAATADLVLTLNRFGTRREDPVLASLYRHLAHWPPYLALAWTLIAPADADGRLGHAIAAAIAEARRRSDRIVGRLRAQPEASPAPEVRAAIRESLELFTGDVIAKMVVIGALLRKSSRGR
jgi:hypothetical protein